MQENKKSILYYVDVLIRIVAAIALAPLPILILFLASFATDAPNSGFVPSLLILSLGGALILILFMATFFPDNVAEKLKMFGKYNKVAARIPAYLYAPVGLYFGLKIIAGIAVNLNLPH